MRRERGPDVRNRVEARPCSRGTRPVPIATEFGLQGRMDILSSADVGPLLLAGLSLASFVTAFIGVFTGAAGGVILECGPGDGVVLTNLMLSRAEQRSSRAIWGKSESSSA